MVVSKRVFDEAAVDRAIAGEVVDTGENHVRVAGLPALDERLRGSWPRSGMPPWRHCLRESVEIRATRLATLER